MRANADHILLAQKSATDEKECPGTARGSYKKEATFDAKGLNQLLILTEDDDDPAAVSNNKLQIAQAMTIKGSKEKGKVKLIVGNFDETFTKTPVLA